MNVMQCDCHLLEIEEFSGALQCNDVVYAQWTLMVLRLLGPVVEFGNFLIKHLLMLNGWRFMVFLMFCI